MLPCVLPPPVTRKPSPPHGGSSKPSNAPRGDEDWGGFCRKLRVRKHRCILCRSLLSSGSTLRFLSLRLSLHLSLLTSSLGGAKMQGRDKERVVYQIKSMSIKKDMFHGCIICLLSLLFYTVCHGCQKDVCKGYTCILLLHQASSLLQMHIRALRISRSEAEGRSRDEAQNWKK